MVCAGSKFSALRSCRTSTQWSRSCFPEMFSVCWINWAVILESPTAFFPFSHYCAWQRNGVVNQFLKKTAAFYYFSSFGGSSPSWSFWGLIHNIPALQTVAEDDFLFHFFQFAMYLKVMDALTCHARVVFATGLQTSVGKHLTILANLVIQLKCTFFTLLLMTLDSCVLDTLCTYLYTFFCFFI